MKETFTANREIEKTNVIQKENVNYTRKIKLPTKNGIRLYYTGDTETSSFLFGWTLFKHMDF